MNTDGFREITPWARGRIALYPFLRDREVELRNGGNHCELPCDTFGELIRLPFPEMVRRQELFAQIVEPAVQDIGNDQELALVLLDLLGRTLSDVDVHASIALYQLLISDWRWHCHTIAPFESLPDSAAVLGHPLAYPYLMWLLQNTPDEHPVRFALHMLRHTKPAPPVDVVHMFGLHDRFSGWVCSLVAARYKANEDVLIDIAKVHQGMGRKYALWALEMVSKAENRAWLLQEGYKTESPIVYTAYPVAVHGDLIGRLRSDDLEFSELIDLAAILDQLATGGLTGGRNLVDYEHGPEACRLLIEHSEAQQPDERLFWAVARVVDFVETRYIDDPDCPAVWLSEVRTEISQQGRWYLTRPGWPEDLVERWSRVYGQSTPSVDWLAGGDLTWFHDALQAAAGEGNLEPVLDWVVDFLRLDQSDEAQSARRGELREITMPGICAGGLYGLTEPDLHSVYGQIVLQILQALPGAPGRGWKIIRAGLRSRTRFHRLTAAEALANWEDDRLDSGVLAELSAARLDCDDEKTVAALEAVLIRSGQTGTTLQ